MKMMIVVQDTKTGIYDQPVCVQSYAEVERMLHQTVQEGKSTIAKYPQDFTVWHVANYFEDSGKIEILETNYNIGMVSDIARNQEACREMTKKEMEAFKDLATKD